MNSHLFPRPDTTLATAIDAASFALLHGSRQQQIESGNAARALLHIKGYPVRNSQLNRFVIKAQFSGIPGIYVWSESGHRSIDALVKALEQVESRPQFAGKSLSITVAPESNTTGHNND